MPEQAILGLGWLVLINVASLGAFVLDKNCAEADWRRVPERTLLTLALLGGSPGAKIGQRAMRHKTRKEPFRTLLNGIVALHVVLAAGAVWLLATGGVAGFISPYE